jgi:hypothetical protein
MKDATFGGYLREHERPPAFMGRDGDSYTAEIIAEPEDSDPNVVWFAYLFFLRWRGNEPVGHVESEVLAEAEGETEVRSALEALTLHEVKSILDRLVPG